MSGGNIMVELNEEMKQYMLRFGWKNLTLDIEEITSWCAPPRKEMSVGVTDKAKEEMQEDGYVCEQSELGNVFYPEEGIIVSDKIVVKRMEYPWLTCF